MAVGGPGGPEVVASRPHRRAGGGLREVVSTLVAAAVLALVVRTFAFESYVVDGHSMVPTILNQERVLVDKLAYKFGPPKDGQIIVFLPPIAHRRADYIKRVIATPGQSVSIRDNRLYVDGRVVPEPYIENQEPAGYGYAAAHPLTVPKGHVFVMGDNRPYSDDSRIFGMVPISSISGQVVLAFWPPGRFGAVGQPEPGAAGNKP